MTDLPTLSQRLREAAERASPGPWFYNSYSRVASQPRSAVEEAFIESATDAELDAHDADRTRRNAMDATVCTVPPIAGDTAVGIHKADAAYIALANPAAILALLDECERLRAALTEVDAYLAGLVDEQMRLTGKFVMAPSVVVRATERHAERERERG